MKKTISSLFVSEVLRENPDDYIAKTAKTTITMNQHLVTRIDDIADTIGSSRSAVISDLVSYAFRILDLSAVPFDENGVTECVLPIYSMYCDEDGDSSIDQYIVDLKSFKDKAGIPLHVAYSALNQSRRYKSPEELNEELNSVANKY